ncbi:uncharacterized protein LOC126844399 [Adelges cooleyi]|uniref:uncharacterized protein LOC126844399 n=1 Tax=Adelges cooleyi TaxID=133065 RepID=UPI0021801F78|nr:uncharacterized protein LOC126844399 [Adelges cooleyi]
MDQYDLDEIKTNLKATITSNKGGVDLKMVERDYENIVGERLPYLKLGYKSVGEFIQSLGAFKLEKRGYDTIVSCLSSGKTAHLEQMIRKQKTSSKKSKRKRYSTYTSNRPNYYNYRTCQPKQQNYSKRTFNKPAPMYSYSAISSNKTSNYNQSAYPKNTIYKPNSIYSSMDKPRWPKNIDIQETHSTNLNKLTTSKTIDTSKNVDNVIIKTVQAKVSETLLTESKVTIAVEKQHVVKDNKVIFGKKSNALKVSKKARRKLRNAPQSSTTLRKSSINSQPAQNRLQKFLKKEESMTTFNANQHIGKTEVTLEENSEVSDLTFYVHKPIVKISKNPKSFTERLSVLNKMLKSHYYVSKLQPDEGNIKAELTTDQSLNVQAIKKCLTPSNTKDDDQVNTFIYHDDKIVQQTLEHKQNGVVVSVHSSSSMWVVVSNVEDFIKMQNDFSNFMSNTFNQKPIKGDPKVGNYYALCHNEKWHRVTVKSVGYCTNCDEDTVKIFQIDTGNYKNVCKSQLYHLNPEFYQTKSQAIEFSLSKLKWIGDFQVFKDILIDDLVGKTFTISPDKTLSSPPTINLFDVDTMANMTEVLVNKFLEKCTPKLDPSLNDNSIEAKILSIVDGFWYIRLKDNQLVEFFEKLFSNVAFSSPVIKHKREIDYRHIYLAAYNNTKGRVKVIHFVDETKVKVFFVDYGVHEIVQVYDLIDLKSIDSLIARMPHQAIKIILQLFDPRSVTSKTEQTFYEIIHKNKSNDSNVSVMNICYNEKYKTPSVQLYSEMYPSTFINMVLYKRLKNL